MPVEFLDLAAEIETSAAGKKRVRDHQIRIGIGQARKRGRFIGYARRPRSLLRAEYARPCAGRAGCRPPAGWCSFSSGIRLGFGFGGLRRLLARIGIVLERRGIR